MLVGKRGAEPGPPSSGRTDVGSIVASALTVVAAWHRAMLRLFAPLQGSQEAPVNPAPEGSYEASLDRRLVGFLVTFQSGVQGLFGVILTGHTRLGGGVTDDIVIPDKHVSTHHASLYVDPDTEKVFVNEEKIEPGERRQVRDNDYLRLGATTFIVKFVAVECRGVAPVPHPYR